MEKDKNYETLLAFANKMGYKYAVAFQTPGLEGYYICKTEGMMQHPNGKYGNPKIIAIDKQSNRPYVLSKDQVTELNHYIKEYKGYLY